MNSDRHQGTVPAEIEELIERVLESAGLSFSNEAGGVEQELRAHFEDGLAKGTSAVDLVARFGDPVQAGINIALTRRRATAIERGARGERWWLSFREWWFEVFHGARRLKRAPAFSAMVILTLGLGVGANTAIFTVLNAVLLEDLPYADPDRLVRVYESSDQSPGFEFVRAPVLTEWMTWDEVFQDLGATYTYREEGADLTRSGAAQRINVMRASAGYLLAVWQAGHGSLGSEWRSGQIRNRCGPWCYGTARR